MDVLERCRHNRRVTERFLKSIWNVTDLHPDTILDNYVAARNRVAETISTQLHPHASPVACRIFSLVQKAISDGQEDTHRNSQNEEEKLLTLRVENDQDLRYLRSGGLNAYSFDGDAVKIYYPEGCVMEILGMI